MFENAMNPIGLTFVVSVGALVVVWFGRIAWKMKKKGFYCESEV